MNEYSETFTFNNAWIHNSFLIFSFSSVCSALPFSRTYHLLFTVSSFYSHEQHYTPASVLVKKITPASIFKNRRPFSNISIPGIFKTDAFVMVRNVYSRLQRTLLSSEKYHKKFHKKIGVALTYILNLSAAQSSVGASYSFYKY